MKILRRERVPGGRETIWIEIEIGSMGNDLPKRAVFGWLGRQAGGTWRGRVFMSYKSVSPFTNKSSVYRFGSVSYPKAIGEGQALATLVDDARTMLRRWLAAGVVVEYHARPNHLK